MTPGRWEIEHKALPVQGAPTPIQYLLTCEGVVNQIHHFAPGPNPGVCGKRCCDRQKYLVSLTHGPPHDSHLLCKGGGQLSRIKGAGFHKKLSRVSVKPRLPPQEHPAGVRAQTLLLAAEPPPPAPLQMRTVSSGAQPLGARGGGTGRCGHSCAWHQDRQPPAPGVQLLGGGVTQLGLIFPAVCVVGFPGTETAEAWQVETSH